MCADGVGSIAVCVTLVGHGGVDSRSVHWMCHRVSAVSQRNWLYSRTQILLINKMQREPSYHAVTKHW